MAISNGTRTQLSGKKFKSYELTAAVTVLNLTEHQQKAANAFQISKH